MCSPMFIMQMDINQFAQKCAELINQAGYSARTEVIVKDNGVHLSALVVEKKGSNIRPCIYLNGIYEAFLKNHLITINLVAEKLQEVIRDSFSRPFIADSDDVESLLDFNKVKRKIKSKILNTEKNRCLLRDIPHIEINDLSLIFLIELGNTAEGIASTKVTNQMLELWGVTPDELLECANTNQEWGISPITEMIMDMLKEDEDFDSNLFNDVFAANVSKEPFMYVASNSRQIYGAAIMGDLKEMERFSDSLGGISFIILPSSMHEVMLVPLSNQPIDSEEIKGMVKSINDGVVKKEDFLSDNIYIYDSMSKEIHLL